MPKSHVQFLDALYYKLSGYEKLKDNHKKKKKAINMRKGRTNYISHLFVVNRNVVVSKMSGSGGDEETTLLLGSIVKSQRYVGNEYIAIIVLQDASYKDDCWKCPLDALTRPISEQIYPYLLAVPSPCDRILIAEDSKLCKRLTDLQVTDSVEFFLPNSWSPHVAVIKHICLVEKIGPGLYFDLEFLDTSFDPNSQTDEYFSKRSENGFFVSVDRIRPISFPLNERTPNVSSQSTRILLNKSRNMSAASSSYPSFGTARRNGSVSDLKKGENVVWINKGKCIDCQVKYPIPSGENVPKVRLELRSKLDDYVKGGFVDAPVSEVIRKDDFIDKGSKDLADGEDLRYSRKDKICAADQSSKGLRQDSSSLRNSHSNSKDFEHSTYDSDVNFLDAKSFCSEPNIITNHSRKAKISSLLDSSNKHSTVAYNNAPVLRKKKMAVYSENIPVTVFELLEKIDNDDRVKGQQNCQPLNFQSVIQDDHSSDENEGSCGCYDNVASLSDFDPSGSEFTIGSLVVVNTKNRQYYGVIRWIGQLDTEDRPITLAGIEMEQEDPQWSNGTWDDIVYFQCPPNRACFFPLSECQKDTRFLDDIPRSSSSSEIRSKEFGQPVIPGIVKPIDKESDLESLCGKNKGIQGHHNSCYLDATLFAMFTFTSVFDSLLFRPRTDSDIDEYEEVQRVLKEEIVNPLRENMYVRADRVMKLRTLLDKLSSVSGLTSEEKDPEEFLNSLLAQILKAEPFLKLSSGQEAYYYQLFVEKDEQLKLPTVQQLFEQSFLTSDIKLKEVPSCLIIQMPRFGKSFKMYPRILPSQLLDVTDVIEDSPRQCSICGKLAEYECNLCFRPCEEGLQCTAFCKRCCETAHNHEKRRDHRFRKLNFPSDFEQCLPDHYSFPRLYMELFAVVCIETSHYVAFVKAGCGSDAPWCFFDSMADRKGEQNGYNIPEMVSCPDLPYWLSDKGSEILNRCKDERQLPEPAKRLLCDAYMCMYQSREVMMYR